MPAAEAAICGHLAIKDVARSPRACKIHQVAVVVHQQPIVTGAHIVVVQAFNLEVVYRCGIADGVIGQHLDGAAVRSD